MSKSGVELRTTARDYRALGKHKEIFTNIPGKTSIGST